MQSDKKPTPTAPLWTRDFTIITVGSVISMLGNALSGFAMSLMVLDISKSTLLYAIYLMMYTGPQLIMPILGGAVLDRISRKKMIYTLDFISAGLYAIMAGVLATGWFSFPLFAAYCFLLGSIESVYQVAYQSFYPLLITEGNYQKAYSIASVLETTTAFMVPVSTFLYNLIGLPPLLAANAVCFFAAAVMETRIAHEEQYIETQKETALKDAGKLQQLTADMKEGFSYLKMEKGLMAVVAYFAVMAMCDGVTQVITLPYFKNHYHNGEYVFIIVIGMMVVGRMIGGMIHYKTVLPAAHRYVIALTVYITISLFQAVYLFLPIPVMMILCFADGIGGVTSYTIRESATQSYVPDEMKGRFNGVFHLLFMVGALTGEMLAGLLATWLPERPIMLVVMTFNALAALVIIGGAKKYVAPLYNRVQ